MPTLAEWLHQQDASPVRQVGKQPCCAQLADAVQHAHSRGVLHRDIKPSNVLLEETTVDGGQAVANEASEVVPKLTDFGMAKLLEQSGGETRTGAIIGTPAYMSPEQAEGRLDELDARTDVYALGAVLYELLVGSPPFRGQTDVDTLRQLMANEPSAPRRIRRDMPRDLEAITLKCLEKRPEQRYCSAQELAKDLQRFLARANCCPASSALATRLALDAAAARRGGAAGCDDCRRKFTVGAGHCKHSALAQAFRGTAPSKCCPRQGRHARQRP